MEVARHACEVGAKKEIEVSDNYSKCEYLIPLCYTMLCYVMLCKEQFLKSVFLAKPCQPNRYDD